MILFTEYRRKKWSIVTLLAMVVSGCTINMQTPVSRRDVLAPAPPEMRPLSTTEKTALAKALSKAVSNPNAAQFKWLPVATNGSGPIGYCGLINVKTASGEYVGFRRFFALVSKGPKGDYVKGQIEHIDVMPLIPIGDGSDDAERVMGLTEHNCKEWGYTDFDGAS